MRRCVLSWAMPLALLAAACALPAHAGRPCTIHPPTVQSIERGMQLAQQTSQALDASGARVVLLGRAGQDLSAYGLRYSHLGWAYKTEAGPWRVVHKLNDCHSAVAAVYRQGLGEFFLDDLWRYEAVYAVPTPELQQRLLAVMHDKGRTTALQHAPYSMVSYAWGFKFQQSNQWALETLALAMESDAGGTRPQAQAWLQVNGYEPTTLKLGTLTRMGARVGAANIAFDDHPADKRFSGQIDTVTVDSVLTWMQRTQLAAAPVRIVPKD